jgi:hypothetical protein
MKRERGGVEWSVAQWKWLCVLSVGVSDNAWKKQILILFVCVWAGKTIENQLKYGAKLLNRYSLWNGSKVKVKVGHVDTSLIIIVRSGLFLLWLTKERIKVFIGL